MAAVNVKNLPTKLIEVARIHPNPWNPNRMDDRTLQAERESLITYGFVAPVLVRPHPDHDGDFQIIDGEHRWKLAGKDELDLGKIPCTVAKLGDTAARKLTVILNETRGQADDVLLGQLLAEIQQDEGDELRNALRYEDAELKNLLALAEEDWEAPLENGENGDGQGTGEWVTLNVALPRELLPNWEAATAKVNDALPEGANLHAKAPVRNGQIVEALIADYLAGP